MKVVEGKIRREERKRKRGFAPAMEDEEKEE